MAQSAIVSSTSPGSLDNNPWDYEAAEHISVHSALIPRSESGDPPPARRKGPALTRLDCLAIVISLQVGSGVFSAPSLIAQHVHSPAETLGVFFTAGLLVWTGAASFIELGLLLPSNGGIQEYLRASWGDYAGFLFTWIWVGVVKPGGSAAISTIFADYILRILRPSDPIPPWSTKAVAFCCVASLTAINCLGATAGAKAAKAFMILKLAALGSVIVIGLTSYLLGSGEGVPASDAGWFGWHELTPAEPSVWDSLGSLSTAVFAALFCYGGWESAGFVVGEMTNPAKDLPIVINGAMTVVIIGFVLMNASIHICLPFDVVRESKAVAVELANRTIGAWGGVAFTIIVALSAMGAINANVFGIAKLSVVAAQRAYFPPVLANLHCATAQDEELYFRQTLAWPLRLPVLVLARLTRKLRWEHSVPIFAVLINGTLTSIFIIFGSLTGLITLIEMIKVFFFMMSVLGVYVLRRKVNDNQTPAVHCLPSRTYRTWTGNPIIFAFISGLLIFRGALSAPLQAPVILSSSILVLAVLYRRLAPPTSEMRTPA